MSLRNHALALVVAAVTLAACGPRARIPEFGARQRSLAGSLADSTVGARLARSLAPVLFLQRDESFPLSRVVAVLHPTQRIIAYHLLWRDDAHGSWIPFTIPTDQEIVWVGYDSTNAPTELWAYWHGKILHTPWKDRGPVAINVQWGKHGSLPRGIVESDLPRFQTLNGFYAVAWAGLLDLWLGKLTRPGPGCFCHGFDRYREFTRPLLLSERVDVVAHTEDPKEILAATFGHRYSKKKPWP